MNKMMTLSAILFSYYTQPVLASSKLPSLSPDVAAITTAVRCPHEVCGTPTPTPTYPSSCRGGHGQHCPE